MISDNYYCCTNDYKINPIDLKCSLAEVNNTICYIEEWATYYTYNDENEGKVFDVCDQCFKAKGSIIILPLSSPKPISKKSFIAQKNDKLIDELSVKCNLCTRKYHAACVRQIETREDSFICNYCRSSSKLSKTTKLITSNIIPPTDLSQKIEKMVSQVICNHTNTKLMQDMELRVNIRVVADGELNFKLDPPLVKYAMADSNDTLTYRGKTILAFQMLNGVETLFFALYVHEFGDDTIPQNRRRVYIAYLDSVNYFEPKEIRTDIYKEILLGYLANARQRGFLHAHIWSCPPDNGKEYIFFRHPISQKVPSQERLINWYKSMLDNGVKRDIIIKHQNLHSYLVENSLKQFTDIPLFDGDYWPHALTEVLRVPPNKRTSSNVLQSIRKFQDTFFVITLHDKVTQVQVKSSDIGHDSQCTFRCTEIVNRRDTFLYFCRDALMEFSSLRRAQLATIKLLTELKRENLFAKYTCDNCRCQLHLERFSCPVCVEFDLCRSCYKSGLHPEHQMQKIIDKSQEIYMYDVMEWLNHALRCKQCTNSWCLVIKSLIIHTGSCQMNLQNCKNCRQFMIILQTHIHTCQNPKCILLHCQKKKEQDKRHQAYLAMVRAYENKKRYERARGSLEYHSIGFSVPDTMLYDEKRLIDFVLHQIKFRNLSEDEFLDWCSREDRITEEIMYRLQSTAQTAFLDTCPVTSPTSVCSEDSSGSLKRRSPSYSTLSSPSQNKRFTPSPGSFTDRTIDFTTNPDNIPYNKLTASQLIHKKIIKSSWHLNDESQSQIPIASQLLSRPTASSSFSNSSRPIQNHGNARESQGQLTGSQLLYKQTATSPCPNSASSIQNDGNIQLTASQSMPLNVTTFNKSQPHLMNVETFHQNKDASNLHRLNPTSNNHNSIRPVNNPSFNASSAAIHYSPRVISVSQTIFGKGTSVAQPSNSLSSLYTQVVQNNSRSSILRNRSSIVNRVVVDNASVQTPLNQHGCARPSIVYANSASLQYNQLPSVRPVNVTQMSPSAQQHCPIANNPRTVVRSVYQSAISGLQQSNAHTIPNIQVRSMSPRLYLSQTPHIRNRTSTTDYS